MGRQRAMGGCYAATLENGSIFRHMLKIKRFLYDEGPHKVVDIAPIVDLTESRTSEILSLMKDEGLVEYYKYRGVGHWKVGDHVEMADE